MSRPIYFIEATATVIKNKRPTSREVWIVSTYDNPSDIMKNDSKTMSRLREELLSKNAKNKTVLIESIKSIKRVGTTSNASNYLQKSVQEKRKWREY